jgi:hypothetical protein
VKAGKINITILEHQSYGSTVILPVCPNLSTSCSEGFVNNTVCVMMTIAKVALFAFHQFRPSLSSPARRISDMYVLRFDHGLALFLIGKSATRLADAPGPAGCQPFVKNGATGVEPRLKIQLEQIARRTGGQHLQF